MAARRLSRLWVLTAAVGGTGLAAVCLAASLLVADMLRGGAVAPAEAVDARRAARAPARITYDPEFTYESRSLGPAQQFEIRLRLVLPNNPHGYSLGVRQTVGAGEASLGRFLRLSARLPGSALSPRPRLELSVISRDHSR